MIGNSVRNTYLARPGDQLPDGSRIREIHPTQVVLEVGGNLETVGIFEDDQPAPTRAVYTPPPPIPVMPPMPPPGFTIDATPARAARLIDPGEPRLNDPQSSDTPPAGKVRASELPPADAMAASDGAAIDGAQKAPQALPTGPLSPSAQDRAGEFGADRRSRAEERGK